MFRTKVIISILEEVLGLLQPLHPVLELQIDLWLTKMVPYDSPCQKTWCVTPKLSLRTKVIISLLEEVLGLLQSLHPILELQIDLWLTKMVPYDSPCQKIWGVTPKLSLRTKVIISLLEEVLGLLQPLHPVLGLQMYLRLTKMVPYDSPCQKHGA